MVLKFIGYRHLPMRTNSNQPLELTTLFIYSCLEYEFPIDSTPSPVTNALNEERQNGRKAMKGVLVKTKDLGDKTKPEKEVFI